MLFYGFFQKLICVIVSAVSAHWCKALRFPLFPASADERKIGKQNAGVTILGRVAGNMQARGGACLADQKPESGGVAREYTLERAEANKMVLNDAAEDAEPEENTHLPIHNQRRRAG